MSRHPIIEKDLEEIANGDLPWGDFANATVLVTGAYGFIPAYLIEALLFQNEGPNPLGLRVVGLCRNPTKAKLRFADYLERNDFTLVYGDASDPCDWPARIDYLIHAASWASPKYYGQYPVDVLKPNTIGTANLLEFARQKKVSGFLFFSSAEIYGEVEAARIPVEETCKGRIEPMEVRSCYAESKRMGETMCASWFHQYGVPAKVARIFHTYGPGMALDDGRVFADFVADIVAGRNIVMKSDGRAIRAYCYLADAVTGLLTILLKGKPGEAYNLGNEDAECDVTTLAQSLVDLFPDKGLRVIRKEELRQGYLQSTVGRACPDTSKLRELGWEPGIGIREGFRRTVASYQNDL